MVLLNDLTQYLDQLLETSHFRDYCPNGLQVEGKPEIKTLVTGVSASHALIEAAVEHQADAVLVHHGYFWHGEDSRIIGIKQKRLQLLLQNNINLLTYHLPLDAHLEFGNNAQFAKKLSLITYKQLEVDGCPNLLWLGQLPTPMAANEFQTHISESLNREPLHIAGSAEKISTVAWCTGAAQKYIGLAFNAGAEAYLTGEVSENTVHTARETGIHFYACGHHASERYGVAALGDHLADHFGITHHFVNIENPV